MKYKKILLAIILLLSLAYTVTAQGNIAPSQFQKDCEGTITQVDGILTCEPEPVKEFEWKRFWEGFTEIGWVVALLIIYLIYELKIKK